jgi:uncharacterized integral membrane protein (TIGR00697 family)
MIGSNELVFLAHLATAGAILLAAARLGRTWVTAMIVVCTVLMNIAVMKQMTLFGLEVTGGNVLFATVFLASDVLNEHYGRRAARTAVLIGFCAGLTVLAMMSFVLWYAPNRYDDSAAHLSYFFGISAYPRIVAASMLSYLLAQLLDVSLYHLVRRWTGSGRLLWLRSNASTWVSQAFDTVFFTTVGLTGTVIQSWAEWRDAVLFAYLIKIAVAALDTPFLYLTTWRPLRPPESQRAAFHPA